jgi:hypothetical protein
LIWLILVIIFSTKLSRGDRFSLKYLNEILSMEEDGFIISLKCSLEDKSIIFFSSNNGNFYVAKFN